MSAFKIYRNSFIFNITSQVNMREAREGISFDGTVFVVLLRDCIIPRLKMNSPNATSVRVSVFYVNYVVTQRMLRRSLMTAKRSTPTNATALWSSKPKTRRMS